MTGHDTTDEAAAAREKARLQRLILMNLAPTEHTLGKTCPLHLTDFIGRHGCASCWNEHRANLANQHGVAARWTTF